MRTLALFNLKGGVGKTSAAVNLALAAAREGKHTVLWDLDAQGAATWLLAGKRRGKSIKRLLEDSSSVQRTIHRSAYPRLDLIPASFAHRKLDHLLAEQGSRAFQAISRVLAQRYDLLVIDAPPSIAALAGNIFRITDGLLMPVVPAPLSLRAFKQVQSFLDGRKQMPWIRAFLSMVDRRRTAHRAWLEKPPKSLARVLCEHTIPYAAAVERMGIEGVPLIASNPRSPAGQAYLELYFEMEYLLFGR